MSREEVVQEWVAAHDGIIRDLLPGNRAEVLASMERVMAAVYNLQPYLVDGCLPEDLRRMR